MVTEAIAERSGMIASRYRVADGRFVLNERDLGRIRFTVDEMLNGLQGVEQIDSVEAQTLIRKNGYKMGKEASDGSPSDTVATSVDAEGTEAES